MNAIAPKSTARAMNGSVPIRPGWVAVAALYLIYAAQMARTLTSRDLRNPAWYMELFLAFIILFTIVLWHPHLPRWLLHLYLVAQCAITLFLLSLSPEIDSVTTLFVILSYQAALVLPSPTRWVWVCILFVLTGGSLMIFLDLLRGLALGLANMASCIALPAFVVANEQTEQARASIQAILDELQAKHKQLQAYAEQADELAAIEERTRLARELHDSVSQTVFGITLNTRAARMLLEQDPARLRHQLEQLQELASSALAQMRGLITELRPKSN